jgi:hypothetical protein
MTSKGSECSRIVHHLLGFPLLLHVVKENVMQATKGSNLCLLIILECSWKIVQV